MNKVGIIMGSDSDLPILRKSMDTLKELDIPFECHIFSAHRTPAEARDFALNARANGFGVLIAAAGRPGLITADCLRPGQTVLDVGVHPGPDGTLCGDVAAEAAALDVDLTPVPGGVGSVTSAVLCKHTVQAAEKTL